MMSRNGNERTEMPDPEGEHPARKGKGRGDLALALRAQDNSARSAAASLRSGVSKPSVNQP